MDLIAFTNDAFLNSGHDHTDISTIINTWTKNDATEKANNPGTWEPTWYKWFQSHYTTELRSLYQNSNCGQINNKQDHHAMFASLKEGINNLQEALKSQHSNVNQLWANQQDMAALTRLGTNFLVPTDHSNTVNP